MDPLQCMNEISVECFNETWFIVTAAVVAIAGILSLILLSIFWTQSNPESKSAGFEMRKSYKKFKNKFGNIHATDNHYKEEIDSDLKSSQSITSNSKDKQIEKNDPEMAKKEDDNEGEDYDFYIRNETYESHDENEDDSFYITNTEYESSNLNAID